MSIELDKIGISVAVEKTGAIVVFSAFVVVIGMLWFENEDKLNGWCVVDINEGKFEGRVETIVECVIERLLEYTYEGINEDKVEDEVENFVELEMVAGTVDVIIEKLELPIRICVDNEGIGKLLVTISVLLTD